MNLKYIIAIDGYSACGKSTLAKDLADRLNILYFDSGALYRAITLYCIENKIHPEDMLSVIGALHQIKLQVEFNEKLKVFLNNDEVSVKIRLPEISRWVSEISVIPEVRQMVNEHLRLFGSVNSLVMDGRDIGTVVFPNAKFKFFLTADKLIRAERRKKELQIQGREISLSQVLENLQHRDYIDSTRIDSPLHKAEDAVLIDNSELSREDQLELALKIIAESDREL
ncbi:MAG: (d)CMP kinase [Saprospiraceae bacterium]